MYFSKKHIVLLIIIISFLVIIFYIGRKYYKLTYSKPTYKGRGYCDVMNEYIPLKLYDNFISPEETKHVLELANPLFRESRLVSGFSENIRKSQTAWLSPSDSVVKKIIERVCNITNIPFENTEKIQVVKYGPNGFYNAHYDASCDDKKECVEFEKNGGQRVLTMILYLNDDFTGGYTDFPNLKTQYKPKKYSGLLFYSLEKNGNKCHPLSLHSGMPVKSGNKYIANIWLREKKYTIL